MSASAIMMALRQAMTPTAGTAETWTRWLDTRQQEGLFSARVRNWLGVDGWLSRQVGDVPARALSEFVRGQETQLRVVDLLAKQSHTEHRHLAGSHEASTLVLMAPLDLSGMKGLVLDQVCKVLGYRGWSTYLTPEQVAHATACHQAQEYGPGQGPAVRPETYKPYGSDLPNALIEIKLTLVKDAGGETVALVSSVDSPWCREGRLLGYTADWSPGHESVPEAPMKNVHDWVLRAMKQAAVWAAERGATQVAWIDGMQKCRLNLLAFEGCSLRINRKEDQSFNYQVFRGDGWPLMHGQGQLGHALMKLGSVAAEKLRDAPLGESGYEDVEVTMQGDETNFVHDLVLPSVMRSWVKAHDADLRAGEITVRSFDLVRTSGDQRERISSHLSESEGRQRVNAHGSPHVTLEPSDISYRAYSFALTPVMKLAAEAAYDEPEECADVRVVGMGL
ncbi:hypothetical protein [Xanthomonas citri]|uniref:hypothetical protein n=1 Tax=Xanthomonas citri TaxID=346 RepID=UPI000CCDD545|nr:hypothetical protein [Xanthomonas citri]PNV26652.1 hypothetical protein xavtCFBP7764_22400 [Xanthomonas citri]